MPTEYGSSEHILLSLNFVHKISLYFFSLVAIQAYFVKSRSDQKSL